MLLKYRNENVSVSNLEDKSYKHERINQEKIEENIQNKDIVDISKAEYSYDEMVEDLSLLNYRYKGKINIYIIGKTYDKRNIYEVIIGNENAKNHVLIHAGIHGSEYLNCLIISSLNII